MINGVEAPTDQMRIVAKRAADIAADISRTMNGLDAGVAGMIQTTMGLVQRPLQTGQMNSMDAFARLSRTLTEVAGNVEVSANKVDATDAAGQDGLARHIEPTSRAGTAAGGSGMNMAALNA